ncbi:LptF/LptG family permease [Sedimentisphaera salicampi]|uniref:Lipopolysaccharide ABC transporter permease n=1 Tax=Sedimentisphaera salicampi TaxID=1941349 RepID=A0A1W6LLY9_9BACT|nr:LptF/LptG family permease [Sedimentisphaera salicampi]ARN56754.1 lipopolysaccharide ABC transporter permease [Sedimentisphaera salicampi]
MKTIDKYISRNFFAGYIISAAVLVGLRMLIDLFVNFDEFAETEGLLPMLNNIFTFYAVQSAVYFRDFAGVIAVFAAAFTLGRMTRDNELVAIMASGISLKRVIAPILAAAALMTGLLIIDQEIIIPGYANLIVRSHDSINQASEMSVECLTDSSGNIIYAGSFSEADKNMKDLTVVLSDEDGTRNTAEGWIKADMAVYKGKGEWKLYSKAGKDKENKPLYKAGTEIELFSKQSGSRLDTTKKMVYSYNTDLTPETIPVRNKQKNIDLLSSAQLARLAESGARVRDRARLYVQRYSRFTDPIINFVMLMVALPVLVCRDKKQMKFAALKSFSITAACFIFTFACKIVATEPIMGKIMPDFWAALPVIVFMPIAVVEMSSIKT